MSFFAIFFFFVTIFAVSIHFLGLLFFLNFIKNHKPKPSNNFPPVTIIKPCLSVDDNEENNFDQFFNQDYPAPFQILFVASNETDPAVELVKKFIKKYPNIDAELVISKTRNAYFRKVDAIYDGHKKAKYDYFIISDSDTYVNRDYIRNMVSALKENDTSLVSTPQWDFGANNFPTALKMLANNCDSAIFILLKYFLSSKNNIALGHSMGFRLSEFKTLLKDNWNYMNSFLSEDLAYSYLFANAGKKVVLKNIFCPVNYANKKLKQVINQKNRWVTCQRLVVGNRFLYLTGLLIYPEISALLYFLTSSFSLLGLAFLIFSAILRIIISAIVELKYLKNISVTKKYFWTVPIWDFMQIYFFINGFLRNKISYYGRQYQIVNRYFLKEIKNL